MFNSSLRIIWDGLTSALVFSLIRFVISLGLIAPYNSPFSLLSLLKLKVLLLIIFEIAKILDIFQIKITQYLDQNYINKILDDKSLELPKKAHTIKNGFNFLEIIRGIT